jgi:hypothetical protein
MAIDYGGHQRVYRRSGLTRHWHGIIKGSHYLPLERQQHTGNRHQQDDKPGDHPRGQMHPENDLAKFFQNLSSVALTERYPKLGS